MYTLNVADTIVAAEIERSLAATNTGSFDATLDPVKPESVAVFAVFRAAGPAAPASAEAKAIDPTYVFLGVR